MTFEGDTGEILSNSRVRLSTGFMEYLAGIAKRRYEENREWGNGRTWPVEKGRERLIDIEGAYGEGAVHLLTGLTLNDGSVNDPDLGTTTDVRQTRYKNGCLAYGHDRDKPERFYFLAIGEESLFHIPGFIKGKDAMKVGKWRDDWAKPCWGVPQELLSPWRGTMR